MKCEFEWFDINDQENLLCEDVEVLLCYGEGHVCKGYMWEGNFYDGDTTKIIYDVKYWGWLPIPPCKCYGNSTEKEKS